MKQTYLTPAQLARRWDMSVRTLANWRSRRTGPSYIKLSDGRGGRVRYLLASVEQHEAQQAAKQTGIAA